MGPTRRRRRPRLRAAVRRRPRQEEEGQRAEEAAGVVRRAPARDGRRPRRRGDRLASAEVLNPKVPVERMVFHEITRDAIERALGETREIDQRLVDAQETRRILDRLYGYEVSPVLWKKVMPRPLRRAACSRSRRGSSSSASASGWRSSPRAYWDIEGDVRPRSRSRRGSSRSTGKRVAQGRDFGDDGKPRSETSSQLDEAGARGARRPRSRTRRSRSGASRRSRTSRRPAAPFMTSTLQQEASRKLRFTAQTTMRVAQRLYENGYITYMRTDSTTLSESALTAARAQAAELYGAEFVPGEAAPVRAQGEERAGGARGDPPVGRLVPHAAAGAARAVARRARAVRADLDAHGRVADGGRARARRSRCASAATSPTARSRVRRVGHGDHVPRLPRRVRGGPRREPRRRTTTSAACRTSPRATP